MCWIADTEYDVIAAVAGDFAVSGGTEIQQIVDKAQYLVGTAAAGTVTLDKIEIRRVNEATKLTPTEADGGTYREYDWSGLDVRPYLIVMPLTDVDAPTTITAYDDTSAPTFTRERTVAVATDSGLAILIQPKTGTMRVRIPKTASPGIVCAQAFDGPFNGCTVDP
jgi:hypothetical protein